MTWGGLGPAPTSIAQSPAPVEGTSWKLVHLDLDVTIRAAERTLRFAGRARLRLESDSSTGPSLSLNTRGPQLRFTKAAASGASVRLNVTVPGDSAARLLRIRLPRPARRGAELETTFEYEMVAPGSQLLVLDSVALASWVENWYPTPVTNDGYTQAAASAPGTTQFHLPAGWRALSNGTLASDNTWKVTQPVARSFVAGPFTVAREQAGGRDVSMYLLGAAPAAARDQARTLSRAITAMESRFGPYPYAGYAVAEVPESSVTWAASSEQGFIMARTSMFDAPGGNLPLFAHEAAHAWWGNVVNTTGPGSRMGSEALAQYGAVVAIEALEGRAAVRDFLDFSRPGYNPLQCALGYFHIWREGEDVALSALEDGPSDHNLSDSKGMWFYHMTRDRLGDAAFFGGLRRLLADFSTRPMSVPDIRAAFLAAAPADSGLAGFLDQWLSRAGAPVLDVEWWSLRRQAASRKEEPTGAAELRIRQRQPGEPYALDLEVLVTLRDSSTVLDTVRVRRREETFQLELPRRPIDLQVDPHQRVLLWRPKYGPRPPGTD
jgi:aminopeptidase N